jgi:hypothetical protein
VGIGVQTIITDHDLALVGDVRGHPGKVLYRAYRFFTVETGTRFRDSAWQERAL